MSTKISNTEKIRQVNRNDIINALRQAGPMARIDLGNYLGLSPSTVTTITAQLQQSGLIYELADQDKDSGVRGRPRVAIDLTPKAACVIAIKLSINELQFELGDYKGNIHFQRTRHLNTRKLSGDMLVDILKTEVTAIIDTHGHEYEQFRAIGIAVQGFVDSNSGTVVWSPALGFRHMDLATPLSDAFSVPVVVANDTDCIGVAVQRSPQYKDVKSMAVIMINYGVGMCLIMNGGLYLGGVGAVAEFGHTKFSHEGPQCRCGKRGCIEAYVSDYAIYRDACLMMELPETDVMHPSEQQMQDLADRARQGDEKLRRLYADAGRVLGVGIGNLLALLGPEKIILTGSGIRNYDLMESGIFAGVRDSFVEDLIAGTAIETLPWQEDLTSKGVVIQALSHSET
ncbi:ROK family protein [Gynuella sp.]|uniref:ROK family protein n=1 Tax=Gynuella sp. TaxID=2969146 RepID=UPI003D0AF14E